MRYRRYKRPGLWRACELMKELNRRLNLGFDTSAEKGKAALRNWFYYLRHIGLIPEGELHPPAVRPGMVQMLWTDAQVETMITDLAINIMYPE